MNSDRAIDRRGACPALSAPMQTGDGLLVRLNPVHEGLTPKQLIGLCESAARQGNGIVEITARGSIQIRGLTPDSVGKLAADVNALAIDVRTGVPVEINPLAGLDPTEATDPRPLATAIRSAIDEAGLSARLGPKVSVVVESGGQIGLGQVAADIRLTASRRRNATLWRIGIAGNAQTQVPMGASLRGAAGFAVDLLGQIADLGIEARARDLVQHADSSSIATPQPMPSKAGLLIPLNDFRTALAIALPFGSVSADMLRTLVETAQSAGVTELRLGPGRMILALCPTVSTAETLRGQAADQGFITDPADPRLGISACPGTPACASGHIPTRNIATEIATTMPDLLAGHAELHVSGCCKGCAHPAPATLTLVGDKNGIGLVANGTARHTPLAYTNMHDLKQSLRRLAQELPQGGR